MSDKTIPTHSPNAFKPLGREQGTGPSRVYSIRPVAKGPKTFTLEEARDLIRRVAEASRGNHDHASGMDFALEVLELVDEEGWISVEERLPDPDKPQRIDAIDRSGEIRFSQPYYGRRIEWLRYEGLAHWRPAAKGPKT